MKKANPNALQEKLLEIQEIMDEHNLCYIVAIADEKSNSFLYQANITRNYTCLSESNNNKLSSKSTDKINYTLQLLLHFQGACMQFLDAFKNAIDFIDPTFMSVPAEKKSKVIRPNQRIIGKANKIIK